MTLFCFSPGSYIDDLPDFCLKINDKKFNCSKSLLSSVSLTVQKFISKSRSHGCSCRIQDIPAGSDWTLLTRLLRNEKIEINSGNCRFLHKVAKSLHISSLEDATSPFIGKMRSSPNRSINGSRHQTMNSYDSPPKTAQNSMMRGQRSPQYGNQQDLQQRDSPKAMFNLNLGDIADQNSGNTSRSGRHKEVDLIPNSARSVQPNPRRSRNDLSRSPLAENASPSNSSRRNRSPSGRRLNVSFDLDEKHHHRSRSPQRQLKRSSRSQYEGDDNYDDDIHDYNKRSPSRGSSRRSRNDGYYDYNNNERNLNRRYRDDPEDKDHFDDRRKRIGDMDDDRNKRHIVFEERNQQEEPVEQNDSNDNEIADDEDEASERYHHQNNVHHLYNKANDEHRRGNDYERNNDLRNNYENDRYYGHERNNDYERNRNQNNERDYYHYNRDSHLVPRREESPSRQSHHSTDRRVNEREHSRRSKGDSPHRHHGKGGNEGSSMSRSHSRHGHSKPRSPHSKSSHNTESPQKSGSRHQRQQVQFPQFQQSPNTSPANLPQQSPPPQKQAPPPAYHEEEDKADEVRSDELGLEELDPEFDNIDALKKFEMMMMKITGSTVSNALNFCINMIQVTSIQTVCRMIASCFAIRSNHADAYFNLILRIDRRLNNDSFINYMQDVLSSPPPEFENEFRFMLECVQGGHLLKVPSHKSQLLAAIRNDDVDTIKTLISSTGTFNFNQQIKSKTGEFHTYVDQGCTLLEYAAFYGALNVFKYLRSNKAEFTENIQFYAVAGGDFDIVKICEEECLFDDTPILAAKFHRWEIFEWLIDKQYEEYTHIHIFSTCLEFSNFRTLLKIVARKKGKSNKMLLKASRYDNFLLFKWLANQNDKEPSKRQFTMIKQPNGGFLPIHYAVINQNLRFVKFLCEVAPDEVNDYTTRDKFVVKVDPRLFAPIHFACKTQNPDWQTSLLIVRLLLGTKKIDINEGAKGNNVTPLHYACKKGNIKIVQYLLKFKKLNVNCQTINKEMTPLHYACQRGYIDIVKALIARTDIQTNLRNKVFTFIYDGFFIYLSRTPQQLSSNPQIVKLF